jgi:hypothetical protein
VVTQIKAVEAKKDTLNYIIKRTLKKHFKTLWGSQLLGEEKKYSLNLFKSLRRA